MHANDYDTLEGLCELAITHPERMCRSLRSSLKPSFQILGMQSILLSWTWWRGWCSHKMQPSINLFHTQGLCSSCYLISEHLLSYRDDLKCEEPSLAASYDQKRILKAHRKTIDRILKTWITALNAARKHVWAMLNTVLALPCDHSSEYTTSHAVTCIQPQIFILEAPKQTEAIGKPFSSSTVTNTAWLPTSLVKRESNHIY